MFNNFLEIQNTTFVASKLNKVLDFNLTIKNEGDIICLTWTFRNWKNNYLKIYCRSTKNT